MESPLPAPKNVKIFHIHKNNASESEDSPSNAYTEKEDSTPSKESHLGKDTMRGGAGAIKGKRAEKLERK